MDSAQLSQTLVTIDLRQEMVPGKNIIWCASFQIAWNALLDEIVKGQLEVEGAPVAVRSLNQKPFGRDELSRQSYLARAGLKREGVIDKVAQELKDRFNGASGFDLTLQNPDDILVFAYLWKDVIFFNRFENLTAPLLFQGRSPVAAFGVEKYTAEADMEKRAQQVTVLDYADENDFIISLRSTDPEDELILAKVEPQATFLETIEEVLRRSKALAPLPLEVNDVLRIPKFDFKLQYYDTEIVGKKFLNAGAKGYAIGKAVQAIRFKLNDRGARPKSGTAPVTQGQSFSSQEDIRAFIFDKQFLLCLKQKNARYPYCALWVDNAELLIKR